MGIPIIGVADTNCDPDEIDYIIPGNDDALRAIRLIAGTIAQAYLEGKAVYEAQQKELADQMERQRQLQAQQVAREAAARAAAAAAAEAARTESRRREGSGGNSCCASGGCSCSGRTGAKPKTTVRKALQRKPKSKKPETDAPVEATANPSAEKAKPAEEDSKLVTTPDDSSELTNGHEASGG